MLMTVLTVLFPEDRPRQIGLSVAAAAYLVLTLKFSRLRIPDLCSSLPDLAERILEMHDCKIEFHLEDHASRGQF